MRVVVDAVSKTYRDRAGRVVDALSGVRFTIDAEEFVALLGPSGCGKSTLLSVIAGLLAPTAGGVYFETESPPSAQPRVEANADARPPGGSASVGSPGSVSRAEVTIDARPARRRPLTAMVFQEFGLFPWRTVQANVEFGLEEIGVPRDQRRRRAREYIELAGLRGFETRYPHQLSGGMRQRVGIARALAVEPAVLLMDEPFSALDAQTRQLMQEELLGIWERTRKTILYVTHNIQEAVFMADRVVVLSRRPGRVLAEVPIELKRPRTDAMMGEPAFVHAFERIWGLIRDQAREALLE